MPRSTIDHQVVHEDGALGQLSRDPASRKRFLKLVGGTGAVGAFSVFLAACGSGKKSSGGSTSTAGPSGGQRNANDLKIVNYALTLEYLESAFYSDVAASGLFKGQQLQLIKAIGEHEREHVAALTATVYKLGGTPAAKPKTKFPLTDAKGVLKLAATVENLGSAAYLGQAANIRSEAVLAAALSIHSVEARHASALNTLLGKSPTPDGAFAKPASMSQVLPQVKPFIVG
ncbi:MAG: ferritin-like domain-containing protein [Actinomycetota bacterium]|nr:ferritin-like domain-containing protein [Actinomycetota bacterium]